MALNKADSAEWIDIPPKCNSIVLAPTSFSKSQEHKTCGAFSYSDKYKEINKSWGTYHLLPQKMALTTDHQQNKNSYH